MEGQILVENFVQPKYIMWFDNCLMTSQTHIYQKVYNMLSTLAQSLSKNTIQNLKNIQFFAQFFIFSKYGEQSDIFAEFLIAIEAIKFYFKVAEFYKQKGNIYLEVFKQQQKEGEPQNIENKKSRKIGPLDRILGMLQEIKDKPYSKAYHQPQFSENLPNSKTIQMISSRKVPSDLKPSKPSLLCILSQLLYLLRPLLTILAIRVFGRDSYKPYFISMALDILIVWMAKNRKVGQDNERRQLFWRRRQATMRYLFKKPVFDIVKGKMFEPFLQFFMKDTRLIYKLIMYLVEMQSSITLTL